MHSSCYVASGFGAESFKKSLAIQSKSSLFEDAVHLGGLYCGTLSRLVLSPGTSTIEKTSSRILQP
eukprot:SAG11_NODE_17135_length_527_cov_1.357477_1_plen_65_part_01